MTVPPREALADFNRAIELDPDDRWAIGRRGEIYREMDRYGEALADFSCRSPGAGRAGASLLTSATC
jgi:regulator of sirC expression with transglutaminase-like and TPR domain